MRLMAQSDGEIGSTNKKPWVTYNYLDAMYADLFPTLWPAVMCLN